MRTSFDLEKLFAFLKSFYTVTGIKISVFDDQYNNITEYPDRIIEYCTLIRRSEEGHEGCRKCDIAAFKEAYKRKGLYIYTCHAGMTEVVSPIMVGEGVLGYVILSHMLPSETYEKSVEYALMRAFNYGVKREEALPAIKKVTPTDYEKIEAASRLLDAITTYLRVRNLVGRRGEELSSAISEYIDENLGAKLNTELLCRIFFISRTKLHQISNSAFGVSITRYILDKRMKRAEELLRLGMSVEQVAEAVGFSSANYFTKVFHKKNGSTPRSVKKESKAATKSH